MRWWSCPLCNGNARIAMAGLRLLQQVGDFARLGRDIAARMRDRASRCGLDTPEVSCVVVQQVVCVNEIKHAEPMVAAGLRGAGRVPVSTGVTSRSTPRMLGKTKLLQTYNKPPTAHSPRGLGTTHRTQSSELAVPSLRPHRLSAQQPAQTSRQNLQRSLALRTPQVRQRRGQA